MANLFARAEKKATWLAGDTYWRHPQPITFVFSLLARKKYGRVENRFSKFTRAILCELWTSGSITNVLSACFFSWTFVLVYSFTSIKRRKSHWKSLVWTGLNSMSLQKNIKLKRRHFVLFCQPLQGEIPEDMLLRRQKNREAAKKCRLKKRIVKDMWKKVKWTLKRNRRMWLAGDDVSACRQPISSLFSLSARTNSPGQSYDVHITAFLV